MPTRKQRLTELKDKVKNKTVLNALEKKDRIKDINDEIQARGGNITLKNVKSKDDLLERLLDELI